MSFTRRLTATKLNKDKWVVEISFRYYVTESDFIDVPAGFVTDLASVPFGLRNVFPKDGDWTQAAVLHDYLYNQRKVHGRKRKECDSIFLEAMKVLGVSWWQRNAMFLAVRSCGWTYWNK